MSPINKSSHFVSKDPVPETTTKILCKEILPKVILVDENDHHTISFEQLKLHFMPSIADAFLAFMDQFPPEYHSPLLKVIKNGEITISCTDD